MTNEEIEIIKCMELYGGSFVKALSSTFKVADADNFRRLKNAFPEVWAKYREMYQKYFEENESKG